MTRTTAFPRITAAEFVAATSAEQRELALDLDSAHSTWMFASCIEGEAEAIWAELVQHVRDPRAGIFTDACVDVSPDEADEMVATMRRLGGTWAGGCLYVAGAAERYLADEEDAPAFLDADPARWVTLAEMAQRTGLALPPG